MEINFGMLSKSTVTNEYDNQGAHDTLVAMMNRKEYITVKFGTDKGNYPYAWVESKTTAGFKYLLKEQSLNGIIAYLMTGDVTDFDNDPINVEPLKDEDSEFKLEIVKNFIKTGKNIQWTPLFRERPEVIKGIKAFEYGKIIFRLKREIATLDYLREHGQIA